MSLYIDRFPAHLRVKRVLRFLRVSVWCVCLGLLLGSSMRAEASQVRRDVALFVQGVDAKDRSAAIWLEGFWTHAFKHRVRTPASSFGVIPAIRTDAIPAARFAFKAGQKLYTNLDLDKASKKFNEAIRLFESALPYLDDFRMLSRVWCFVGVTYLLNGKKKNARQAFIRALLFSKSASLQGISKDQQKIKFFQSIRTYIQSATKSMLRITAAGPASVSINGHFVGVTPLAVRLVPGTHVVVVRRPGYKRWSKTIALSGAPFTLRVPLSSYSQKTSWAETGQKASLYTLKHKGIPESVRQLATVVQTSKIAVAQVRRAQSGSVVSVQVAVYDIQAQKQLATGGAKVAWRSMSGRTTARQLLSQLLQGRDSTLNGWTPLATRAIPKPGVKKKGSSTGLWIGLGVTLGVLAVGGGTVLVVYLANPELFKACPSGTGCVQVTIR